MRFDNENVGPGRLTVINDVVDLISIEFQMLSQQSVNEFQMLCQWSVNFTLWLSIKLPLIDSEQLIKYLGIE